MNLKFSIKLALVAILLSLILSGCLTGNPKYQTSSRRYHIVKKGDTLSQIAIANNSSVKKLKLYNNLVSDLIFPGQKLYLYPKISSKSEYITVRGIPKKGYHLVKAKETLYRIAKMYDLGVIDLLEHNQMNNFGIQAGEKIWLIPGRTKLTAIDSSIPAKTAEIKEYASLEKDSEKQPEIKTTDKPITPDISPVSKPVIKPDVSQKTKTEKKPLRKKPEKQISSKKKSGVFAIPVEGKVTSEFGIRNGKPHKGIDIAAPAGTPILAVQSGKAVYVGSQRGYGNVVILEHKNLVMTVYAHNETNLVRLGDNVKKEQPIATVGKTGTTTGAHLHFEYRVKGKAINPREILTNL